MDPQTGWDVMDEACSTCGFSARAVPGSVIYECDSCAALVCTECSDTAVGNRVSCLTCWPSFAIDSAAGCDRPGALP